MLSFKVHKLFVTVVMLMILIVCCAPVQTAARRVIFYAPARVYTGQLISVTARKEPCPKCQMRDHRGRCRRIVSFSPGEKC